MSTQTAEKIYKEIKELKKETQDLKELFFLVLQDREGEYKDSFVKKIQKKSRLKPQYNFLSKENFLKQIS